MSARSDIAKARIYLRRAEAKRSRELPPLEDAIYQLRREVQAAQSALYDALERNGQCGICEKSKAECPGHVLIAATG